MKRYTAGNWYTNEQGAIIGEQDSNHTVIAMTFNTRHNDPTAQTQKANAKLMASSPKLIEMLKEIEGTLRWAAQEAKGKVNKETVGGWLYHADKAKALIEETTN
jgi:hypothetical protein